MCPLESRVSELEASKTPRAIGTRPASTASAKSAERFLGEWQNVDGRTRGLPKLAIVRDPEAGLTIQAWGACHPTDCDWGKVPLQLLGDSISAVDLHYGFCQWDHGFANNYMTLRYDGEELSVDVYDVFKDDSNRSNYHKTYRFRRSTTAAEAPLESGDVRRVPPEVLRLSPTAPDR